ncbi:MAG: hypothetical protein J6P03_05545 [Opitutales bacterium]|nr:hypothetical protein [Opitutales bacterium]
MANVDLDLVKAVLQRSDIPAVEIAKIIEDINTETKMAEEAKGEKEPPVKKQFVFILSDPQGRIKGDTDYVGWVVQIPEDDNPATALEKLHAGAYDFNRSAKGRRFAVQSVAEACEFGSAKIFKEQKIWIKTKEPVMVVRPDNKIPTE